MVCKDKNKNHDSERTIETCCNRRFYKVRNHIEAKIVSNNRNIDRDAKNMALWHLLFREFLVKDFNKFMQNNELISKSKYRTIFKGFDNETGYEIAWSVYSL